MGVAFSTTPTGAALGALLAPVDPAATADEDLLELLAAESRQLAYQQARQWAVLAELAARIPGNPPDARIWTPDDVFELAVDEARAELVLTRQGARYEVECARDVFAQPALAAALRTGAIDRRRAIVIAEGCRDLTDEQQAALLERVLPGAGEVSPTGLRDRVRRTAIALDPQWAERRYRDGLRGQRVVGYLSDDGTAIITGQGLPADQAAAACRRVADLAAKAKRAGANAPTDTLRVEIYLGLLTGRFDGRTPSDVVGDLVAQFPKPDALADEPAAGSSGDQPAEPSALEPSTSEPVVTGVELRIGLATLLELDEHPGEIAGWGYVPASVARALAAQQRRGQWRFAVVDGDGRLCSSGLTRHRPPADPTGTPAPTVTGGLVELQVPAAMLDDPFFAYEHPGWGPLIRDLAGQYAARVPIEQDPTARHAGRPLRRHNQVRHRTCLFPGCRRPAADCDLDHRHDHALGGPTVDENLGPACRHDHQLKTRWGWRLIKRSDTAYVWISPLGRAHPSRVDPVAPPLPDPIPRRLRPESTWSPSEDAPGPMYYEPPATPVPPPPTEPEPPPF